MDLGLKRKVAVVSGASRGLGRAMARALAQEGMGVVICARNAQEVIRAASELDAISVGNGGLGVVGLRADVTKPADTDELVRFVLQRFGGIDVLVNNAGASRQGTLAELPDEAWREQFELNLFAAVRLSRLCSPSMAQRGGGSVINIGSLYGREAGGTLCYNASKASLHSFTKMLARELAPKAIRVNAIAPGSILFPGGSWERRFRTNPTLEQDFLAHELPAGRLGRPEEVAYAVVMLASPRASWITGACLPVDGAQGRSIL